MNIQEIKHEIVNSLPSLRMKEKASALAVKIPSSGELLFLKLRGGFENTPLSEYIEYKEKHELGHNYDEIQGKFVIVDETLIGKRGKELLEAM